MNEAKNLHHQERVTCKAFFEVTRFNGPRFELPQDFWNCAHENQCREFGRRFNAHCPKVLLHFREEDDVVGFSLDRDFALHSGSGFQRKSNDVRGSSSALWFHRKPFHGFGFRGQALVVRVYHLR